MQTRSSVQDTIDQWVNAERNNSSDALETLIDPQYVGVGPRGFVLTYDQWMARFRGGDLRNQAFSWDDVQIHDHGDTAIAVGVQTQTTYQGHDASGKFRGTLVLVKNGGHWRIASLHLSPIMEQPARP